MQQLSLFRGVHDTQPRPVTLEEVVTMMRTDQRLQVLTENHRRYGLMDDSACAVAEKQHMPCYFVAVLFSGGKQQKHIVELTGLSLVDIDHIAHENIPSVFYSFRPYSVWILLPERYSLGVSPNICLKF